MDDRIQFEWYAGEEDESDLRDHLTDLRADDPGAEVDWRPPPIGVLPIPIAAAIGGVVAIGVLARVVRQHLCRTRKRGMVIDSRLVPVHVQTREEMPGGVILLISSDGKAQEFDACKEEVDLAALLKIAAG